MDTSGLKKFAQEARRTLRELVTAKLDLVLSVDSAARREYPNAVKQLESELANSSRDQVIEKVAYTWFNRFSALRFMDANGYTGTRVLSPAEGQTRPEILSEAMAGVIGDEVPEGTATLVRKLLDGTSPSSDPQGEAYRFLVVAMCNHWHGVMPYMFEKIADYTELLMPDDLLSASSVVARLREVMTDEACQDVEIIGWLYQFYISEKKDEIFAGLKKNKKITPENIPAATQLFTPHWIVRYLVENSLGRLWLLNRPESKLAAQMDYYIAPQEPETDFLRVPKPEEIKISDPACGSGHILTYAFDLLYAVYEEEGYDAAEIPALILTHNLHGVEIDDRAGALAAFALNMKAAARLGRRRFLRLGVQPDICVLQDVRFTAAEMQDVATVVGHDLFTDELQETLAQFEHAKNFGSLIVPKLRDPAEVARVVRLKNFDSDLLLREVQERVVFALRMAEVLSQKYHVVVANPPYMGGKGLNETLAQYLRNFYPEVKSDLFAAFIFRNLILVMNGGQVGFMTPFTWMFIQLYTQLRHKLLTSCNITSLIRPEYHSFFDSAFVPLCAFCITTSTSTNSTAQFIDINKFYGAELQPIMALQAIRTPLQCDWSYITTPKSFTQIPGYPIAYWVSKNTVACFQLSKIGDIAEGEGKNVTADNERFLRFFWEVSRNNVGINCKWLPYAKGGPFRKWAGNMDYVVDWSVQTRHFYRSNASSRIIDEKYWYRPGITWTDITVGGAAFRLLPANSTYDTTGISFFLPNDRNIFKTLAILNSAPCRSFIPILNPTLHANLADIKALPIPDADELAEDRGLRCQQISQLDWDSYETSQNFATLPLLSPKNRGETLKDSYVRTRAHWQEMTRETQRLEEENNRIFIDAYGLKSEMTPEVPPEDITLTCNPAYRYGGRATEAQLEDRLRADTVAEFLHYAVGCMFGRYSFEQPGLILANQGEGFADYLARVPNPSFAPDTDNVIPVLDGDWFADDISQRFREFLRVTFGETHFQENLAFVEEALGKGVRKYFTRDFFNDHVKRYKKRPIYWLFSSPKGTFNALIYMHRYTPDTVNMVLNDYLRVFRSKLEAHKVSQERMSINANASAAQRTAALKDIQTFAQQIVELDDWERDVIYPLATRRIEIDLNDGVKVNYPKFAGALKPIKGLEEAED